MNRLKLQHSLEAFFIEDIGDQDLTSDALFSSYTTGTMIIKAKSEGIFCGEDVILTGFRLLDPAIQIDIQVKDGQRISAGQPIAGISGNMASLLKGERVVLNLIQRMSGIATKTNEAVRLLDSIHTRICDTRKTTPGLRMLEKHAVRMGGGFNHRQGLYDAVMIKDNHITFAGSITSAVTKIRAKHGHMVKIEVETETLDQVIEAVALNVDCIMFDNRTPDEILSFMEYVPGNITTEASGGIQITELSAFGKTGVDYISLGALTHSVHALDISADVSVKKGAYPV
ncbi:carboxylating nicotinate-nucleotide diphosphorylase [Thalassobacillus hwangdonensis]|uniref:nicotinate-nucleotide diphosphorylase (carboxylating) n=1 Tax=Thalassobacillus hwangdonensis TaxID=546108 RepID=A0ABW3L0R8_9BACI